MKKTINKSFVGALAWLPTSPFLKVYLYLKGYSATKIVLEFFHLSESAHKNKTFKKNRRSKFAFFRKILTILYFVMTSRCPT